MRHIVEHRVETCPFVQILDAPVPQGGNQLVEAFRHHSICTSPSRISKCPRSRLHPVVLAGAGFPWCRRRNSWWKWWNSCSLPFLLQKQIVDTPIPQAGHGVSVGFQGSLPGQDYCLVAEENVDIPVPHGCHCWGGVGGLRGLHPELNSAAFCGAEHVGSPVPHGCGGGRGLHGSRPDPNSAAASSHSPGAADEVFYRVVVFKIFSQIISPQRLQQVCWEWQRRTAAALIEQFGDTHSSWSWRWLVTGEVLEVLARRGTPPGQGGIEILARDDCGRLFDHAARVLPAVQVVRVLCRDSVPRQSAGHSSCATEGRFHSAVLEQGCVRQLPMVQTVQCSYVHRHPVLAFRTVEVPQIQSCHFSDSPEWG